MEASVEACAVVEGSSRHRWKWQRANVSRGSGIYGEFQQRTSHKSTQMDVSRDWAPDQRKKEFCNGQAASQLACSQHCASHPGEGQGSTSTIPVSRECGISRKDEAEHSSNTEYSVSSSLGRGCGPGSNLQEVGMVETVRAE